MYLVSFGVLLKSPHLKFPPTAGSSPGHVVDSSLRRLPTGAELEELEDPGARMDCKKYLFFPGCRGSRSKRRLAQDYELGQEHEQEQEQAVTLEKGQGLGQEETKYFLLPTKRGGDEGRRGGLFSGILR